MHVAAFVTVVAIVVGFAASTCANDRPSDPFGKHTVELNEEAYLFGAASAVAIIEAILRLR